MFNDFNLDQQRGQFAYIEDQIIDDVSEQQEVYAALSSRCSGVTITDRCTALQTKKVKSKNGSGMLTSSTRFTTTLHSIINEANIAALSEEGSNTSTIYFGTYVDDDHYHGDYVADYIDETKLEDLSFDLSYRYQRAEEEPFLAMRLFQLGMSEWAEKPNMNVRNAIRRWQFEYDVLPGNNATFLNQGFAVVDNLRIDGDDIVVLKAGIVKNSDELFLENPVKSGDFRLDRPGVFFDHVTIAPYKKGDDIIIQPDTPLWLEHANDWPVDKPIVRLISRPGYFIEGADEERTSPNLCVGGENHFTRLVGTTLDGKEGSSGGLIISPNTSEYLPDTTGRFVTQEMVSVGVFHGFTYNETLGDPKGWGSYGPINIAEPGATFDDFNSNLFTGIADPTVPSRDTPETPITNGAPKACTEEENGNENCIPCSKWNSEGKCTQVSTVASTYSTGGNGNGHVGYRGIEEEESKHNIANDGDSAVRCAFDEFGGAKFVGYDNKDEEFPGMMIGLAGASSGDFQDEDFVSDLYGICAPVGAISFTENWRFLYLKGSYLPWTMTNIKGRRAWGALQTMANESYVLNNNQPSKGHSFRPLPMKTCPPNYYMNGVEVRTNAGGIKGVIGLRCHSFSNSDPLEATGGDQIWVKLDASASGVEGFEIFGEEYTLDQRIGNPDLDNPVDGDRDVLKCDGGYVSGFEMRHNNQGNLQDFHIKCVEYEL